MESNEDLSSEENSENKLQSLTSTTYSSLISKHSLAFEEFLEQKQNECTKILDLSSFTLSLSSSDVLFLSKKIVFFPQIIELRIGGVLFRDESLDQLFSALKLNCNNLKVVFFYT